MLRHTWIYQVGIKQNERPYNPVFMRACDDKRPFDETMLDFNWTAEAIANVLDNAVKYTPRGGRVGLEIAEYPHCLWLDIFDNWLGIPGEELAKIFGRFIEENIRPALTA